MKILQLCHRIPFPPTDGGNIAMLNLASSLSTSCNNVKIVALNTVKHFVDTESLPSMFKETFHVESIPVDTSVTFSGAFFNLFTGKSYNIVRFYNRPFENLLKEILRKNTFDVIQLESLFMMPYLPCIRKYSKSKVVMRAHNVEHLIWKQLQASSKSSWKKWYLKLLTNRLKQYEIHHLNELDAILPITSEDEMHFRKLGCSIPMMVTPLGIDMKDYETQPGLQQGTSLFHLGSMHWLPNREGVQWFLDACWNRIHESFPELKLYLAGKGFPKQIVDKGYPQVVCEGEISDSNRFASDKQIMIVPLLSGSGMRVKIIQGMALAKTIISTSIGAEGIQYTNGKNILIANTPKEYFDAVKKCIDDQSFAAQIASEGKKLVAEKYSNEVIGRNVSGFYQKLINIQ